jgi:hypothetical protein
MYFYANNNTVNSLFSEDYTVNIKLIFPRRMKTYAIIQMSINYKYVQTTHTHTTCFLWSTHAHTHMFYMVYTCTYTHVLYGLQMHIHTCFIWSTHTHTHMFYMVYTHTQHVLYGLHTHTHVYMVYTCTYTHALYGLHTHTMCRPYKHVCVCRPYKTCCVCVCRPYKTCVYVHV